MQRWSYLIMLALSVALFGCMTPSTSLAPSESAISRGDYLRQNTVYVYRVSGLGGVLATNYIELNGGVPEVIAQGEYISFQLSRGTNIIQKFADINQRSHTLLINNTDGRPRYVINDNSVRELREVTYDEWVNATQSSD